MGIYMVSKEAISFIPENTFYGFDHLMLDLMKNKQKAKIQKFEGYWLDIGRPDDYETAIDIFENEKNRFLRN